MHKKVRKRASIPGRRLFRVGYTVAIACSPAFPYLHNDLCGQAVERGAFISR